MEIEMDERFKLTGSYHVHGYAQQQVEGPNWREVITSMNGSDMACHVMYMVSDLIL